MAQNRSLIVLLQQVEPAHRPVLIGIAGLLRQLLHDIQAQAVVEKLDESLAKRGHSDTHQIKGGEKLSVPYSLSV